MIPKKFEPAIQKVKNLEKYDEYLGAFIFGSVARGEINEDSDIDIKVITRDDSPCSNINHPFIGGVKLDITFISQNQLTQMAEQEHKEGRVPMIAESIILFDKNHLLQKSKDFFKKLKPPKFSPSDYKQQQFFIYHADEKVRRNLKKDPDSALLSMTLGLNELIKIHYRINGKWKISSKRMFEDLDSWDKIFLDLLKKFILENNPLKKFQIWSDIIDHIVEPMGGRLPIENNLCDCKNCRKDLAALQTE